MGKRIIAMLTIALVTLCGCMYIQAVNYEKTLALKDERIDSLRIDNTKLLAMNNETRNQQKEIVYVYEVESSGYEVIFTNYYSGDSNGSSEKTGSGLTTKDFQINDLGWYTYQGKVVVATATWSGIHSNYGALKDIKDIPYGYHIYSIYDEFTIEVDGVEYPAIVLDVCGAAMKDMGEEHQRVDIFIADKKYAFGKKEGVVYERK